MATLLYRACHHHHFVMPCPLHRDTPPSLGDRDPPLRLPIYEHLTEEDTTVPAPASPLAVAFFESSHIVNLLDLILDLVFSSQETNC